MLPQPITAFSVGVEARSGKTGKQLWSARWDDAGATTGVSLAVLDDHDGDGARDILVGSSDWYWHGTVNRMGEIRLLSGKTGELIWKIGVDDFEALALSEEKRK
ncbi:MAG: hypothetical protein GY711_28495 [bacterium]|nr:hypothetical protein [bacterium]